MLHGRHAFDAPLGGARHLRGGYVNIDEFANTYNLLRRLFAGTDEGGRGGGAEVSLGNQDWARGVISLPPQLCS